MGLALWLALAGCGKDEGLEVPVAGGKAPVAPSSYEEGPAVTPASELAAWLEANPSVVQLPTEITWTPIGVTGGRVGTAEEALALRLDDSALGIALHDRVQQYCSEGARCALWLEGRWTAPDRFQVLQVVGPVAETDAARVRVVQGS